MKFKLSSFTQAYNRTRVSDVAEYENAEAFQKVQTSLSQQTKHLYKICTTSSALDQNCTNVLCLLESAAILIVCRRACIVGTL